MTDLRQDPYWAKFLSLSGWKVIYRNGTYVYLRKLPFLPLFICKVQRFISLPKINMPLIYSIYEPLTNTLNFSRTSPYLPTATLIINLNKPLSLSQNAKRILSRPSLPITNHLDPDIFYRNYTKYCHFKTLNYRQFINLTKAFGNKCFLLASLKNNAPQSGIILLLTKDTAYYYQTWTAPTARCSGDHYHLTLHAIKLAKSLGLKYFDFDGIEDPRFPRKSWSGFSEFKKKFGGKIKYFPGAFAKWF